MTHFSKFAVRGMKYLYPVMRARIRIWSIIRVPFTVNLKQDPLHCGGSYCCTKIFQNYFVAVKIVALKKGCNITFPYRLPLLRQIPLEEEFQFLVHHQLVLDWNC